MNHDDEHTRQIAIAVRDDHAHGKTCSECTPRGCPRLTRWWPAIQRIGLGRYVGA